MFPLNKFGQFILQDENFQRLILEPCTSELIFLNLSLWNVIIVETNIVKFTEK